MRLRRRWRPCSRGRFYQSPQTLQFGHDHELHPHHREIRIGVEDALRREELRDSRAPRVVMDRHFPELRTGALCLLDELDADGAAAARQSDLVEDRAADQTEVAIDVVD